MCRSEWASTVVLWRKSAGKYGGVTAEGIVESALDKVRMIEEMGYDNLVVSIKSSDVLMCVRAHELIAENASILCMLELQSPERFTLEISSLP